MMAWTAKYPETIWVIRHDEWLSRGWTPLRRSDDPEAWLAEVASGDAVVTQVDDGETTGRTTWPTSSCPAPDIT